MKDRTYGKRRWLDCILRIDCSACSRRRRVGSRSRRTPSPPFCTDRMWAFRDHTSHTVSLISHDNSIIFRLSLRSPWIGCEPCRRTRRGTHPFSPLPAGDACFGAARNSHHVVSCSLSDIGNEARIRAPSGTAESLEMLRLVHQSCNGAISQQGACRIRLDAGFGLDRNHNCL